MLRRAVSQLARAAAVAGRTSNHAVSCSATSSSTVLASAATSVQQGHVTLTTTFTRTYSSETEDQAHNFDVPYYYDTPDAFVGRPAPFFKGKAVVDGEFKDISLDDYKGKFVVLFFYPKDWTFVCPTEIIAFSDRAKEFEAIGCQLIAASTDTEESHLAWIKTPRKKGGLGHMNIPVLADTTKAIAARYGCLVPESGVALRGLYIINPEGVLEQIIVNNMPIGRSVDETLRLVQAIQFVREHGEVCPAGWKPGAATMVADPDKSLDYFAQQEEGPEATFGEKLESVRDPKHFESLVANTEKLVVDFYAPWCGKCRMIAPFVDELLAKHPDVTFVKFDTTADQLDTLSADLGVKGLPTFKLYKGGKEVGKEVIGYKKKLLEEAVAQL